MTAHLNHGGLEVGYVFIDGTGQDTLNRLLPQLDEAERQRMNRFLLLRDRIMFATGRALVRRMFSEHVSSLPVDGWRFHLGKYGKPTLERSSSSPDLRFSISHCKGLVVAVVSLGQEVGVDAEYNDRTLDFLEIARAHFPALEVEHLESLPEPKQRAAFFALWTLREAYLKARGIGFSQPISEFAFTLKPATVVPLWKGPDESGPWSFCQNQPSASHTLSVAIHRNPKSGIACHKRRFDIAELFAA